ncbi:MAG TPA: YCF48-related protein [Candidatus Binataceae bacterium]|nr:YCF48-related protein [Candidatus Binataceae bacterium]
MSRGLRWIMGVAPSAWIVALCAALWLGFSPGTSFAENPQPSAEAGRDRTWENYFGVAILPSERAVIVGDKGLVMTSDDHGRTWQRVQLKKGVNLYDLYSVAFAPDGASGWAVGDGGVIFHSDDRGATWKPQDSKLTSALLKVVAIDAQKACTAGEHGVVLCTADGGASWNSYKFPEDIVFFDLAFTDPNNGWVVGEFATTLRTTDGGKSWNLQTGGKRDLTSDPFFAIAFENAASGLVLGLNGEDMTTADGGKSWKPGALAGQHHSFYAATARPAGDSGELYIGGQDGVAARVVRGEVLPGQSATSNSITGLAFSPHLGLAVGMSGTIMRSEDGGQHWSAWNAGNTAPVRAN